MRIIERIAMHPVPDPPYFTRTRFFTRIRLEPRTSQRDIVARTGFDKSTVSFVVNRFDELGLIVRAPNGSRNRPGRPRRGIADLAPYAGLLIGVQVEAARHDFRGCRARRRAA